MLREVSCSISIGVLTSDVSKYNDNIYYKIDQQGGGGGRQFVLSFVQGGNLVCDKVCPRRVKNCPN